MPRPVPLVLVVKNGSKIFGRCSGGEARPVVAHGDPERRLAVELGRLGADLDRDRGRAGGQGVVEDVAEDLLEAERVDAQCRSTPSSRLVEDGLLRPCGPARGGPRLPARSCRRSQAALLELDRGRVAADVLVEVVQVVLRLLDAGRSGRAPRGGRGRQGEHLQAGLAALQGVAALVGQPGDHLADGGQPLGLQRPLLRLLEERDVLADAEDRRAVLVVGAGSARSRPSSGASRRGRRPGSRSRGWGCRR